MVMLFSNNFLLDFFFIILSPIQLSFPLKFLFESDIRFLDIIGILNSAEA